MGIGGQRQAPAALPPGKRPGTHCIGGWVGLQGQSGRVRGTSPPPGFDPRIVQPLASRYTDWAIAAPNEGFTVTKTVSWYWVTISME